MIRCPYCNRNAKRVGGDVIYPHRPDLYDKKFFACIPCDARVGCHSETGKPLGSLANRELRRARMLAHTYFDRLWKSATREPARMSRTEAYAWLAEKLKLPASDCHIGLFDIRLCDELVKVVEFHFPTGQLPF